MLKHVSNFFLQIFPSVVATVVGAYIVTNYINAKPAADAPKAAVASTAEPARDVTEGKDAGRAAEAPAETADRPKPIDKQTEKPAPESKRQAAKSADKSEKPKAAPAPVVMSGPAAPAPVTVAVAPSAPAATDLAPASDNRDANELARAALDRLRGPVEAARQPETPRQPEVAKQPEPKQAETPRPAAPAPAARTPEPPKVAAATPAQPHVQQTVQPLPPAMLVTTPSNGAGPRTDEANAKPREPVREERSFTSFRPPADIPLAPPLDLQAASRQSTSITDDVVSTARSVFHAVIPR